MSLKAAARVGDDIAHSNAGTGMLMGVLAGAAVGAVLIAATLATGGLALVAAAGAAAGMVSAGGLGGMYIGEASMGPSCGKFATGSPTVFINGKPALFTAGSFASCSKDSGPIPLATGSSSVFINTGMAGREGEKVGCSAVSVARVSPDVYIGGESAQDPAVAIQPEVPQWAVTTLQALGVAGAIAALPYSIVALGVAGTIGAGGLGAAGAFGLATAARPIGEAMGLSEVGIRSLETAGGFLGGMIGGGAAARYAAPRWGASAATQTALARMPMRYQGQYATAKASGWRWPNEGWPPNNGKAGLPRMTPLAEKTPIDRYGAPTGGFTSPAGEPFPARAMRGSQPNDPPTIYKVKKEFVVEEADIAPWFDQPGGGKQYRMVDPAGVKDRYSVQDAIDDGYLE
ncbi:MAG: DUF4237 domain-containing protein [Oxalobacteraceae bacterium]|nr:MAG: DUF4237 domain-containing protein [Oxalobacteraceae bacterium]